MRVCKGLSPDGQAHQNERSRSETYQEPKYRHRFEHRTADDRPDYIGWILYQDERLIAICALIIKEQREIKDETVKGNGRRQS